MQQIRSALSLFNGISGLHLALDKAQINVEQVYYSEIDKFANKVTEQHYPNDIALGDVTKWKEWDIDWSSVDLVSAGFPCQAWSVAGKQLGDKDERGMLFWTTLEIIAHVLKHNPKARFLMENVKMKKDFEEYITHHTTEALGYVEKTLINSALVSAQNRNRYYWTNFEVAQPEDRGILLKDIVDGDNIDLYNELENDIRNDKVVSEQKLNGISQTMTRALNNGKNPDQKANSLTACAYKGMGTNGMTNILVKNDNVVVRATVQANAEHTYNGKVPTLTAAMGVGGGNVPLLTDNETASQYKGKYIDKNDRLKYRKLTPLECERLQTLPEIKKSVIIELSEKHGKIEWLLEHQRTNVSVGAKYRKLQSSALSAEEKELNQCAGAAMSCLSISQADQEMPVQKNVHIILGEGQLQLNYQGDQVLHVNIVELLKKQVHPALEENTAQEIAGINLILEKILPNGKVESQAKAKNSTHQVDGKKSVEKYGKEITHHAKNVEPNVELAQMDMSTTSDHGQNSKTLDSNLQILFCCVLNVIDSFTQEEIQNENLLRIKIDYSCGFTSMISNTQRYKALGNAWTVDVIAHIFKCMQ